MIAKVDAGQGRYLGVEDAVRRVVADKEKLLGGIGEVDSPLPLLLLVAGRFGRFKIAKPEIDEGGRIAVIEEDDVRIRGSPRAMQD